MRSCNYDIQAPFELVFRSFGIWARAVCMLEVFNNYGQGNMCSVPWMLMPRDSVSSGNHKQQESF